MVYIYVEGVGNSFACALGIFAKKTIEILFRPIIIWYSQVARFMNMDRQAGCIGPDFGISTISITPASSTVISELYLVNNI